LIGDAAHTVHPLAGQGVNLGFADSANLASCIIEGMKTGQDIGSLTVLRNYEKQRMASNLLMMAGIDSLKRMFDSRFLPVTFARNVGLHFTNSITPLKQGIIKQAMGLGKVDVSQIGK